MNVRNFVLMALLAAMLSAAVAPARGSVVSIARVTAVPIQQLGRLTFRGETGLTPLATQRVSAPASAARSGPIRRMRVGQPLVLAARHAASRSVPIPLVRAAGMAAQSLTLSGFAGLSSRDQFDAGTLQYADTQTEVEPANPTVCTGNGFVVEAVNNAVAAYTVSGTPLTAPTAFSQFFHERPEISPGRIYGASLSSPNCYFDRDTQRWFLSEQEIDQDPTTGYYTGASAILLAVSRTGDPTAGYSVYSIDTTNGGSSLCPCFGLQPRLGADANGIFISVNEFITFPVIGNGQETGAQIYAFSKIALAKHVLPTIVHIDLGAIPTPDFGYGPWSSIQPATTPDTAAASRVLNGTEFFLSALDFSRLNDDRIAVWALTNTQSLINSAPQIGVQHIVIPSEAYGTAPAAVQKFGTAPLAISLRAPVEKIDTGDDRMTQAVFAGGTLWSALTTAVRSNNAVNAGLAVFAVAPGFDRFGTLTATIVQQQYIASAGQNVMYPAVAVNASGSEVIAATVSGPQSDPTAVYVTPDGRLHIAAAGVAPEDGYSGYAPFGGYGTGSWGAYSTAIADSDGSIWFATDNIFGRRTVLTNWSTYIGHVRL